MDRVAILALLDRMVLDELVPVGLLVGRKNARAFAKRTDAIESRKNGIANKLRPIGDICHRPSEGVIHFESDDFVFAVGSHRIDTPIVLLHCITFQGIRKDLGIRRGCGLV
jgi:hypothetical protein